MTHLRKTLLWLLLLLLCLVCGHIRQESAPTPAREAAAPATPEPTAEPTPLPTPQPTATPAPTAAPTAASTPSPTAEPTPTPVPTFCPTSPAPFLQLRKSLVPEEDGRYLDKITGQRYRFGSFGQGSLGFYRADAAGEPSYGAALQPFEDFLVSPYVPETPPRKDGERWLTVFQGSQSVVCFLAMDGEWEVERIMICSCADTVHQTPPGSHYIYSKYAYKAMTVMDGIMVYAQYACRFRGHYLFHTVPIGGDYRKFHKYGKKQMLIDEYEKLGSPASHGCVRLLVGDAYWIYKNCPRGTRVMVVDLAGPAAPAAPPLIYEEPYMNADHTLGWDPTDPDKENPYRTVYPEWFKDL